MGDLITLIDEFFNSVFNLNAFIGIVFAILVFTAEIIYMNKHTGRKNSKKVEKAKRLGNVVTAKRVKSWNDDLTGSSVNVWEYGTYVYEVHGKRYQYKYMNRQKAPMILELYYIDNPRKAFTDDCKEKGIRSLLFYIVPVVVAVIIINLLGGV